MMRIVLDEWKRGLSIGRRKVTNLRFADDTVLITSSIQETEEIMLRLKNMGQEYGLKIDYKKSNVMDKKIVIMPSDRKQVSLPTVYWGAMIHENGSSEHEIRRRIQQLKLILLDLGNLDFWIYHKTCTVIQAVRKRIDAFEFCCW